MSRIKRARILEIVVHTFLPFCCGRPQHPRRMRSRAPRRRRRSQAAVSACRIIVTPLDFILEPQRRSLPVLVRYKIPRYTCVWYAVSSSREELRHQYLRVCICLRFLRILLYNTKRNYEVFKSTKSAPQLLTTWKTRRTEYFCVPVIP